MFSSIHLISILLLTTSLPSLAYAKQGPPPHSPASTRDVHAFPNGTWVENMAIRKWGQILVTLYSSPELYEVDPSDLRPDNRATLVHRFLDQHSLLGITEVQDDIFAVAIGKEISPVTGFATGFSIWTVDARRRGQATKIVDIPDAGILNGLTTLDVRTGTLLAADSVRGVVYRVSIPGRSYSIAIDDPAMKASRTDVIPLGVNGLKIKGNTLYFTNTNQGILASIPIKKDGTPSGSSKVLASIGVVDDLTTPDEHGFTFVAGGFFNGVIRVNTRSGEVKAVVGASDSPVLYNPTATQFGRTKRDNDVLYVAAAGGTAAPIPGVPVQGGKIVAVYGLNR